MSINKIKIAREIFDANKVSTLYMCDDGNVFFEEKRAKAHASENACKYIGEVTRQEVAREDSKTDKK